MEHHANLRRNLLICAALLAITVTAFWPVIRCDFVQFDDPDYVTQNPHVLGGLSLANLGWAFRTGVGGNWHPLTWVSHMLDCQFYGAKPAGHHVTSLLLHAANTLLLFGFLQHSTGTVWRSATVAGLFALHPLHVESVTWIAERKDVLSTFFGLLCLWAYAWYAGGRASAQEPRGSGRAAFPTPNARPSTLGYLAALLCFALSLMSKPMLVTLPFLLLLLDYWPLGRLQPSTFNLRAGSPEPGLPTPRGLLIEKLPFFALGLAVSVLTFVFQREAGAVSSLDALPLEFRVSNAVISYVRYAADMFWPSGLAVFYPTPATWPAAAVFGAALLLAATSAGAIWLARTNPWLPMGWFWFVGTLIPVIGIVQVGQQALADRYTYVPLIGLFIIVVWSVAEAGARSPAGRIGMIGAAAAALTACALGTRAQLVHWQNNVALFTRALAVTRDNAVAHNNLGVSFLQAEDPAAAESHFAEAVRLKPHYADAVLNLGLCREKQGSLPEAVEWIERAVRLRNSAAANFDLANLLTRQGRLEEAEPRYAEALRLKPEFPAAHFNLGILKARLGKTADAAQEYAAALRLQPEYPEVHQSFGALLAGQRKYDEAIAHFEAALRSAPDNADAHYNLAAALSATGRFAEAEGHYAETCRLRPQDLEARMELGLALLHQGKMAESLGPFEAVLRAQPQAPAHYYLGLALDGLGRGEDAVAHYREAVRLAPGTALYLNDLAWLLATNSKDQVRDGAEAVRLAEEACRLSGGKEPRFWGTLDAAYAEAGRFSEAETTAAKTRDLALAAGQPEVAQAAGERLAGYHLQKPYRTAVPVP